VPWEIPVVAADWSGALSDEHRHLWLAVWDPDAAVVTSVRGMTRAEAGAAIITLAERDPRLIAGLDFCFSLPAWWLDANGIATAGSCGPTPTASSGGWPSARRRSGAAPGTAAPTWAAVAASGGGRS
jgi:hypothetical protein